MSFIKVTDSKKREELIKDFIEKRKRIKDNFFATKVGESEFQSGITKLFKPVTETQKATAKEITEAQKAATKEITGELKPIKEGIGELPLKLFNQVFPSIEFNERDITNLGPIAVNNLKIYFSRVGGDAKAGIYDEDGSFKIGSKPVRIKDDNIYIDDTQYQGTPDLWKLITQKNIPDISEYTPEDLVKYIYIMKQTNTTRIGYDLLKKRVGGSNIKMNELIKPFVRELEKEDTEKVDFRNKILEHFKGEGEVEGEGLTILPNDPNALIERFDLLLSSQNAGHTGVRNELVSIFDELKRQGAINTNDYKKLNSIIKK